MQVPCRALLSAGLTLLTAWLLNVKWLQVPELVCSTSTAGTRQKGCHRSQVFTSIGGAVLLRQTQQRAVRGGIAVEHELALEACGLHQAHLMRAHITLQRCLERKGLVICNGELGLSP